MNSELFNFQEIPEEPVVTQEREYDKKIEYYFTFGEATMKFSFSLS